MSNTSSPSQLVQATPKRAPGVKRLNSVPKLIGAGVLLVFFVGVIYTAISRHNATVVEQKADKDTKKVEGGHAPSFLTRQAHGEVMAASFRPQSPPPAPAPASSVPGATAAAPSTPEQPVTDQSGSDVTEQARVKAWQQYYQQRDELEAKRYEMDVRALTGSDAQQGVHIDGDQPAAGGNGAIPPVVTAAGGKTATDISTGGVNPEGQAGKQAFLKTQGDPFGLDEDLPGSVHGPKPLTVMEGTPIPGRLIDAATSDSPGQLVAEVMTNVCDSMTGETLLIPQGTRIITKYDTAVSAGQDRMGTIAQRLIFPDTSSRQLGSMQIADQSGMAGLKDLVDTHFWEKFWATATISLVGAGAQLAQPPPSALSTYSPTQTAAGSMTQGFQQLGESIAQRGLSIPNTITLRSGLPLVIKPNHDIKLPPYIDARGYTGDGGACS